MDYIQKIKLLYELSEDTGYGYTENEISAAENTLGIKFPKVLRDYYIALGKNKNINESSNTLLNPNGEIGFTEDENYLVFYEENQSLAYWAVNKNDLYKDSPKIYRNFTPNDSPDEWVLDSETTEGFLLAMAYWNGALGGLNYNTNYSNDDGIDENIIEAIENNWQEIIGTTKQDSRFFTNTNREIVVLTVGENNANGIYTGTNQKELFEKIIKTIKIEWDYRSDEDEE